MPKLKPIFPKRPDFKGRTIQTGISVATVAIRPTEARIVRPDKSKSLDAQLGRPSSLHCDFLRCLSGVNGVFEKPVKRDSPSTKERLINCDPAVLDFTDPWPVPLVDPETFSQQLGGIASEQLKRLREESKFLDFLPFRHILPDPEVSLYPYVEGLAATARIIQGLGAIFQPVEVTEYRKRRAIVPAAQKRWICFGLLRPHDFAQRSSAGCVAEPSIARRSHHWTVGTMEYRIPAAFPHPAEGDGLSFRQSTIQDLAAAKRALLSVQRVFGSFEIWKTNPSIASAESLAAALSSDDPDRDEYLFDYVRTYGEMRSLRAYVAEQLWGGIKGHDFPAWRSYSEDEIN